MNTKHDIEHEERIDITVLVTGIDEWDHNSIARKVELEDINQNSLELTVFHNNDIADFEWKTGTWYRLENAVGNHYQGKIQLNPSFDLNVTELDEPPEQASTETGNSDEINSQQKETDTEASAPKHRSDNSSQPTVDQGKEALKNQALTAGNYLLHFKLGELPELTVHEYELRAENNGGINPEDFTNGIQGFTAKAAVMMRRPTGLRSPIWSLGQWPHSATVPDMLNADSTNSIKETSSNSPE